MYELLSLAGEKHPDEFWRRLESFQKGLACYKARRWQEAINHFNDVLALKRDDMVAHLYIQRSLFFINEEPPGDWNGVFVMTRK
jgi:adenylate cyclase